LGHTAVLVCVLGPLIEAPLHMQPDSA